MVKMHNVFLCLWLILPQRNTRLEICFYRGNSDEESVYSSNRMARKNVAQILLKSAHCKFKIIS